MLNNKFIFIGNSDNLTFGKEYLFISFTSYKFTLLDDNGEICDVEKDLNDFVTVSQWISINRDNKIKKLGL
jgi:hypothetical protein